MKTHICCLLLLIAQATVAQNVGIGINTPKGRLHIKGSADTSQLVVDANGVQSNSHPLIRLRSAAGIDLLHIHSDSASNTFIGLGAGKTNQARAGAMSNTFMGTLSGTANTLGYGLTALGTEALYSNISGIENVAIGQRALYSNQVGYDNTAVGNRSLYWNGKGVDNTAIGFRSLFSNTTGNWNTAVGSNSLSANLDGINNTAIGQKALYLNSTGFSNTATGDRSLVNNSIGNYNTAIGTLAFASNYTGSSNTGVGFFCDVDLPGSNQNTIIGYRAHLEGSNSTIIGSNAYTNTSNLAMLGNVTTLYCGGYANWTNYLSDRRLKTSINEEVKGLDFILRLRPVTYHMDVRGLYRQWGFSPYGKDELNMTVAARMDIDNTIKNKESVRMSGFIAQEVEAAAKQAGYDFDGIKKPAHDKDNYGLSYASFVVPLVKAVQEQQAIIMKLESENDLLKQRLEKVEALLLK